MGNSNNPSEILSWIVINTPYLVHSNCNVAANVNFDVLDNCIVLPSYMLFD